MLRAQTHRELNKARHAPEARSNWAKVLESLFAGSLAVRFQLRLVEVHIGVDLSSLAPERTVQAADGDELVPITMTQLNEQNIEALRPANSPHKPEIPSLASPASEAAGGSLPPAGLGTGAVQPEPTPAKERVASETASPVQAPPVETVTLPRTRVYLGDATGAYGRAREIWLEPELPDRPLPNPHICVTGETGSGKTQAAKAILHELLGAGLPALVLDFKDDYSDREYVEAEGFALYDAAYGGMPFNPMTPPTDPRTGRCSPITHIHQLGGILKRVYRLGDQQAFHLREGMKAVYAAEGIDLQALSPGERHAFPPFERVRDILIQEGQDALLGRLSPIFDLRLFASVEDETALHRLLDSAAVIRVSQLPGDEIKNAVAEFLLMALYNHIIRQSQPRALRRLLVLDEAWRLVQSPYLEPLMREGRAFGLGVIVATQFPKDLPEVVAGSAATKLFFSQTQSDQIRDVQRSLTGKTSGPEAEQVAAVVRSLPPLTCLLQNAHYSPYARVAVRAYYERVQQ